MLGDQISQLKTIQITKKFDLFMIKTLPATIIPTKFHINVKLGIVGFFSFNSDIHSRDTWAAKTAEVVFPDPPFPKKVTNLVDF